MLIVIVPPVVPLFVNLPPSPMMASSLPSKALRLTDPALTVMLPVAPPLVATVDRLPT